MRTSTGVLVAVPITVDFDDVFAHWHRKHAMPRWRRAIAEGVDRLPEDGRTRPRVLVVNHPWLIGQPWRIGYLDDVLAHRAGARAFGLPPPARSLTGTLPGLR